jgi:hypothetical protein
MALADLGTVRKIILKLLSEEKDGQRWTGFNHCRTLSNIMTL